MRQKTLGLATIDQAPREDLRELFMGEAPRGTSVVLRGCLDGLSEAQIAASDGDDTPYTRLREERDIKICKRAVIARAADTIAALRRDEAAVVVFACTGEFPSIPGDEEVIYPTRVRNGLVAALLPAGRLGILVPLAEQIPKLKAKWARPGLAVFAEPLLPSQVGPSVAAAAARLLAHRPQLVAMDCMGYSRAAKAIVKPVTRVPTLLAASTAGAIAGEMLD